MKVFKMLILSLLVLCGVWAELAKRGFYLIKRQKSPQNESFFTRLIERANLAV